MTDRAHRDPGDNDALPDEGPTDEGRPGRAEHGEDRHPRTGETASQRHTRQIDELLMETRVAAVGIQVIIGFLLAVPFDVELQGVGKVSFVVAILSGMLATGLLLAPSVLHRALLHRGQAVWIVAVGTRLLLAGAAATAVALVSASLLVGDRVLDGPLIVLPPAWTALVLTGLWFVLPLSRNRRLDRTGD